ncbi:MAG: ComEC/Rec2 family competence protein [Spirochaetaceae bacterium]
MSGRDLAIDTDLPGAAACGAAVSLYLTDAAPGAVTAAAACAAALAVVLLSLRSGSPGVRAAVRVGLLSAALAAGLLIGAGIRIGIWVDEQSRHLPVPATRVRGAAGTVRGLPDAARSGWTARVELEEVETASGSYRARYDVPVYGLQRRPERGGRLRVAGRLIDGEHGPYLIAESPGELERGDPLSRVVEATIGRMGREVDRAVSKLGPAAWLSRALLLGRSDGAPAYAQGVFRRSGTAHILALSGMHLGILIALSLMLLAPLLGRRRALYAALALVALYLAVVGFRASLARAALMFALATVSVALGRRPDPRRILAASFIALAAAAPSSVDGLSFQLSFAALAGILTFGRTLDLALQPVMPAVLRRPVAASVGAQLATLPLLLGVFGVARPVGVVATLVMAPVAVLFMWLSVVAAVSVAAGGGWVLSAASAVLEALETVLLSAGEMFSLAPALRGSAEWAPIAGAAVIALGGTLRWLEGAPAGPRRPGGGHRGAAAEDPDAVWGPL